MSQLLAIYYKYRMDKSKIVKKLSCEGLFVLINRKIDQNNRMIFNFIYKFLFKFNSGGGSRPLIYT